MRKRRWRSQIRVETHVTMDMVEEDSSGASGSTPALSSDATSTAAALCSGKGGDAKAVAVSAGGGAGSEMCAKCPLNQHCMNLRGAGGALPIDMPQLSENSGNSSRVLLDPTDSKLISALAPPPDDATQALGKLGRRAAKAAADAAVSALNTRVDSQTEEAPFRCRVCAAGAESHVYSLEHVRLHNSMESCWLVADGVVYDATAFLDKHPAGSKSIMRRAGGAPDASKDFHFHSKSAKKLWKEFAIGRVKGQCEMPSCGIM